jgi:hypothetical protein
LLSLFSTIYSFGKDLCKAEAQTIQLLQTAQTTATHLAAATSYNIKSDSDNDSKSNNKRKHSSDGATAKASSDPDKASGSQVTAIQKCMKDYQSTVEQIQALLAPHAELVKANQVATRLNRMYQARVELRLADEKQNLLQESLRLQKAEETAAATATLSVTGGVSLAALMEGVESESSKRKRQYE